MTRMSAEQADAEKDRLCALLKAESLLFGDFTLASGRKSAYYFDSKKTTAEKESGGLDNDLKAKTAQEKQLSDEIVSLQKADPTGECKKRVTALESPAKQEEK